MNAGPRDPMAAWTCWQCGRIVVGTKECLECVVECDECTTDLDEFDEFDAVIGGDAREYICHDHCFDCRVHPFGTCSAHEIHLDEYRARIDRYRGYVPLG